jgi:hypothetical protein
MAMTRRGDGERRVKLRATPHPARRSTMRVRFVDPDELRNGQPTLSHPVDLREPRP